MRSNEKISVVIPIYGCTECLLQLHTRLIDSVSKITNNFEIIMVNDGSPDNAWNTVKKIAMEDQRVKGINLSKNFGQHYAIKAGIDNASGDYIVVMDCDLQDRPEEIIKLYTKIKTGYDVVYGCSPKRGHDSILHQYFSKLYYHINDYLRDDNSKTSCGASFTIFNKKVLESLKELNEFKIEFLGLLRTVGYRHTTVNVLHSNREEGESSYTFVKKINHAIVGIVANSTKLLRIGIGIGSLISVFSFMFGFYIIINKIFSITYEAGWSSLITSIFFMGGLIMILIGILGLYIENIFYEVKRRPKYFIDEIIN